MADYFGHWLWMGSKLEKAPKIFHVNWFKQDKNGDFLWPGYGENLRVLEWILDRCNNQIKAKKTPIGYIPRLDDIDMTGLRISKDRMKELFRIDRMEWKREIESHREFLSKFGNDLPNELSKENAELKKRFGF